MKQTKLKVFVYGTLKPQEANYAEYCEGKIIESIAAYAFGCLYHLSVLGYPAMTEGKERVFGYLLAFEDTATLDRLDRLETYSPDRDPTENEYQRRLTQVYNLDGESLGDVWAYFMTSTKVEELGGILVPSGCWRENENIKSRSN
jgi:gamma-glutamylcyclotransferase (GGCT)/AIG2-like uncharacterized protein YtfP